MSFLYVLQKLKKKEAALSRVIELEEESEQSCSTGKYFFKLKIFILFHNLLLLTVTSFIYFTVDDRFILILLGNRGPTTKESGPGELDNIPATEAAKKSKKMFGKVM